MLVLTRKKGESIMIGDQVELVVLGVEGETVKIGIKAPQNVEVYRKEVYLSIQESNREASNIAVNLKDLNALIKEKRNKNRNSS
ncbi:MULTISPECIES: carbon storage regulator CsrA [Paenibacillus]|uniref:Translational regulator CsrA n=1 Tax=Paenibacillus naphthalenovorans TaxID=162209 RepID=A0A0U2N0Q5_9BACL|nr:MULTISPECIES: carbon storage regulator CsrA [Paenibacillus]ALS24479.1 carbon storage regulator [Paenibacillus naphthalenovorans]NTZ20892.1 carbon storage regulator [Paenibacillus sp. JMULE4]